MGTRKTLLTVIVCVILGVIVTVVWLFPGNPGANSEKASEQIAGETAVVSENLAPLPASDGPDGAAIYKLNCAGCHGDVGKGDGPFGRMLYPAPRDFTRGTFAFRSTSNSEMPTDDDLLRTVSEGLRWSAMPPFKGMLTLEERKAVVAHLKSLSGFADEEEPDGFFNHFEEWGSGKPIYVPNPPVLTQELLKEGKQFYLSDKGGCVKCHGSEGAGDGPSAPDLKDNWDNPIRPRDLRLPIYQRGNLPREIFLRIRTGLPGTPMPAASEILTDQEAWAIAFYVQSLQVTPASLVERGRMFFGAFGCAQCHGNEGCGGMENPNYVNGTIPPLNNLAEKMLITDPEDVDVVIRRLEAGADLETDKEFLEVWRSAVVLAQLRSIQDTIIRGRVAGKKNAEGPEPAIHRMPTWGRTLTRRNIEAIVAYLLTLQKWEEEEEEEDPDDKTSADKPEGQ